jgi:hypothetical protein
MKTIVRTLFGSHLYGTNTETSDTDRKAVHLPNAVGMLLHKKQDVLNNDTKVGNVGKNAPTDVDDESFALHRFFAMLANSDTMAIEMLFTPEHQILEVTPEWRTVLNYRDRFITKNIENDLGYIVRQSAKYGVKGGRMATVRLALQWVENWIRLYGSISGLGQHHVALQQFADANEHSSIIGIPHPSGEPQWHWEVVGRKLPFRASLGEVHKILTQVFDNYGERVRQAERNDGVDWKALSHAVRVGHQTIERLETGELTFPRPNAKLLLRIKRGELEFKRVEEKLELLIEGIKDAHGKSDLRETIDQELADQITLNFYSSQVFQTDPRKLGWAPASEESLLGEAAFKMAAA